MGIVDTRLCVPACRSPPVTLVFAKSAQDAGSMYRRGGEGEKEGAEVRKKKRMTYERTVGRTKESRMTERRREHKGRKNYNIRM